MNIEDYVLPEGLEFRKSSCDGAYYIEVKNKGKVVLWVDLESETLEIINYVLGPLTQENITRYCTLYRLGMLPTTDGG